ncbi:hypothetical protein AVEN_182595-1 [Araneus ventricosus]|uniref:Uncharacterized protein n=1 Tax=Araneus ventricosus TaxID=182803 RepID=A0A4Y2LVU8_ARAVE|nr:hypothetical protein AVEN_182595-1 [Araneus ventricosus]
MKVLSYLLCSVSFPFKWIPQLWGEEPSVSLAPVLFVVCMNVANGVKRLAVPCHIQLHIDGINFPLLFLS